ncbi:hypothetical protein SDC9_113785 [bioreactor metagenome]|uniref:Uncharacterized protein n=1 Tax=bioreactor metagenome TaxID=1076179 RepID=A0A645BUF8_9ZZZZ
MGVVRERVDQLLDVLRDEHVVVDVVLPLVQLGAGREFPVDQEVGDLEVAAPLGELLDRVAAVVEDALVTVDVGDRGMAGGRVEHAGVEGHQAMAVGVADPEQILRPQRPLGDRKLVGLPGAIVANGQSLSHVGTIGSPGVRSGDGWASAASRRVVDRHHHPRPGPRPRPPPAGPARPAVLTGAVGDGNLLRCCAWRRYASEPVAPVSGCGGPGSPVALRKRERKTT